MTGRWSAVLFDFDYTLGDTERGIVASTRYALEQMGLSQPREGEIRRTIGMTLERSFTALTGSADPAGQAEFSRLFNEKAEEVMVDSAVLYPGARELFGWLETQGIAAGVVTNKNRPDRRHSGAGGDQPGGAGERPGRRSQACPGRDSAGGPEPAPSAGTGALYRGQPHR